MEYIYIYKEIYIYNEYITKELYKQTPQKKGYPNGQKK